MPRRDLVGSVRWSDLGDDELTARLAERTFGTVAYTTVDYLVENREDEDCAEQINRLLR